MLDTNVYDFTEFAKKYDSVTGMKPRGSTGIAYFSKNGLLTVDSILTRGESNIQEKKANNKKRMPIFT